MSISYVLVQENATISSSRKKPRLGRVEGKMKNTQLLARTMASQNLDWNNKWIAHQIRVHHAMEDVDCPIVGSTGHQWVPRVELGRPECSFVVLEGLERCVRKVQIEPNHASIEATNNQVISRRMHIQR